MSVAFRLKRMVSKTRPFYRIVVTDRQTPRDGKYLEALGYYNAIQEEDNCNINHDRALYWMDQGAQPSQTVKQLFSKQGIMAKFTAAKSAQKE